MKIKERLIKAATLSKQITIEEIKRNEQVIEIQQKMIETAETFLKTFKTLIEE